MSERGGKDYLHRPSPGGTERALGHAAFLRQENFYSNTVPEREGTLDRFQRAELAEKIAAEFGWLTLKEMGEKVGIRDPWDIWRLPLELPGITVVGAKLCPGFVLREHPEWTNAEVDRDIIEAGKRLSAIMNDWEQLAWYVTENDGNRPVDVPRDRLRDMVDAELAARGRS
jgi:hypothetical protein